MTAAVRTITATIVDLPTRRPHGFATTTMQQQSLVIVQIVDDDGLEGVGEGVVPGGPWWSGESVESMKLMIDRYLGPSLLGTNRPLTPRSAAATMDRAVAANRFAKAAVEMALWDLAGKRAGCSIAALLGGRLRDRIPITWALSASDSAQLTAEAEQRGTEGFAGFKFKMGAQEPPADVARVLRIREKLPDAATIIVDPNGAWDEPTAMGSMRALAGAVDIVEQPTPGWNRAALARLQRRHDVTVMADESAQSSADVMDLIQLEAVRAVSVKLPKSGGILPALAMADIAAAGGIVPYAGSTLESSIGAAASAQVYATWPDLLGCELVGPMLLTDEIVAEPVSYRAGTLTVPSGPGLSVTLDPDKLRRYRRD